MLVLGPKAKIRYFVLVEFKTIQKIIKLLIVELTLFIFRINYFGLKLFPKN